MAQYPIHLNYNQAQEPVGFVVINEDDSRIPIDLVIRDCAIVPFLQKRTEDDEYRVVGFGMIKRTDVDIRPWPWEQ